MYGQKLITQLASTNGDGTGTVSAIGDYSSGETVFYIEPPANDWYYIARMIVGIQDNTTLDADGYGAAAALTNGVVVRVSDSGGVLYTLTAFNITTNAHWAMHCHDITPHSFGQGNEILTARWTFDKQGAGIVLSGNDGQKLEVVLNDDFSTLIDHRFICGGHYLDEKAM